MNATSPSLMEPPSIQVCLFVYSNSSIYYIIFLNQYSLFVCYLPMGIQEVSTTGCVPTLDMFARVRKQLFANICYYYESGLHYNNSISFVFPTKQIGGDCNNLVLQAPNVINKVFLHFLLSIFLIRLHVATIYLFYIFL